MPCINFLPYLLTRDQTEMTQVTYDPALDPSTRSLFHEVEVSFTQDYRVNVHLSDVWNLLRIKRARQRTTSWPRWLQIRQTWCWAVGHDTEVVARQTATWPVIITVAVVTIYLFLSRHKVVTSQVAMVADYRGHWRTLLLLGEINYKVCTLETTTQIIQADWDSNSSLFC